MRNEFEERVGHRVTCEDYHKIETVYTYYPDPKNGLSKSMVAEMYRIFGMRIFDDLLTRAKKAMELEKQLSQTQKALAEL